MKGKLVLLVVVLLIVAMIPALAMASSTKQQKTVQFTVDTRQPLGPQLDAQLGVSAKGPRTGNARLVPVSRGPAAQPPQPRAVQFLLNTSFEPGNVGPWNFLENGFSPVGWDITDYLSRRGQYSFYSAAWLNDPYVNPFYDNDMESWAWVDMDLTNATRLQVRFQYLSDTEFGFDIFGWCISNDDGASYLCQAHTGSTNNKWRLVKLDTRNDPVFASLLGSPDAEFAFLLYSDFSIVERGAFVDALSIRATGPNN